MKVNKRIAAIPLIITFIFGYTISKMVDIPGIKISGEINPLHFMSILTTVFVAVLVSIFFDQHKEKNKVGKGIFFKRIDDVLKIADHIHDQLSKCEIEITTANSINKRLRSSISFIFSALANKEIVALHEKERIDNIIKDINHLMTNTPVLPEKKDDEQPIKVEDGIIKFSKQRAAQVITQLEVLKNELFNLQMTVNDA